MFPIWIASLWIFTVLGCAPKEEIRVYEAASDPPDNSIRKPVTLLAALAPQTKRINWVFKVTGPTEAIAETRGAILEFFKTVEFPKVYAKKVPVQDHDEPALLWTLPASWTEKEKGGDFRYKTVTIPTKVGPLELTVSNLPGSSGKLLTNVNRWRGQVHRNAISEKELPLTTNKIRIAGVDATLVEINGFQFFVPEDPEPFQYVAPPEWLKSKKTAVSLLIFKIIEDFDEQAVVTVTPAGGTVEANLNRWREQVKLPAQDKHTLLKEAKSLKIAGQDAVYVDYTAPAGKDLDTRRILGAIVHLQGNQLFVKMTGPADLVERQKTNFEQFSTSLLPVDPNQ